MSKQGQKALAKKQDMQEKIKEMEAKVKEYEEQAEKELGKYLLKQWEVRSDVDSGKVYEVIDLLKDEAKKYLTEDNTNLGKYDK